MNDTDAGGVSSIFLIQQCRHYLGWNGMEFSEDIDTDFGYFTTVEACQEACDKLNATEIEQVEKWNREAREDHARAQARRDAAIAQNKVLEPAGLPLVKVPTIGGDVWQKTFQGTWDGSTYYEPVEIEEAK